MAVSDRRISVRGLTELSRAFSRADKKLGRELRDRLKEAAEPVRADAERLAASEIRNMSPGDKWAGMRIGVTTRVVYVAPQQRGSSRGLKKRTNLAILLESRAMQPALDQNREQVVGRLENLLDEVGRAWESA